MSKHTATHMTKIISACETAKEQIRSGNSLDSVQNALIDMSVAFIDGVASVVDAEGGDSDHIQQNDILREELRAAFLDAFNRLETWDRSGNSQYSTLNYEQQGITARYSRW